MDMESVETKPSVQESIGIFQLIDQLESVVDKLLERQVYLACTVQVGVIKTDVALQYCSKYHTLLTHLSIMEENNAYVRNIIFAP
jgi:predicted ATP-dependent Lon-type protease